MRRLTWPWWLALAILTLLFVLLQLPASLVARLVAAQTGDRLQLAAAHGSIWQGSAQPVLQGQALAERLSWSWQASALRHGRFSMALGLDNGRASLDLSPGSFTLREADLTLTAAPLFQLDNRSRGYGLGGQLRLTTPSFEWRKGISAGQLTLDWQNATASLAPAVNPLGDYRISAQPSGSGWALQLTTLQGALQLNGSGAWQSAQGLSAEIAAKAAAGSESSLAPFLNQIGGGEAGAERRLRFNFR